MKIKNILFEILGQELLSDFYHQLKSPYKNNLKKRDWCGPIANELVSYLKSNGHSNCRRIEGFVKLDVPLSDKKDFTTDMKKEMIGNGMNFENKSDRLNFIKNSKYNEQWKFAPHYWVECNGKIIDPTGKYQFINTNLTSDLNSSRYVLSDKV